MRPLALRSAGKEGSSTSIARHVGRRSGRTYETPVIAAQHDHRHPAQRSLLLCEAVGITRSFMLVIML